jgi:hypothetical protein
LTKTGITIIVMRKAEHARTSEEGLDEEQSKNERSPPEIGLTVESNGGSLREVETVGTLEGGDLAGGELHEHEREGSVERDGQTQERRVRKKSGASASATLHDSHRIQASLVARRSIPNSSSRMRSNTYLGKELLRLVGLAHGEGRSLDLEAGVRGDGKVSSLPERERRGGVELSDRHFGRDRDRKEGDEEGDVGVRREGVPCLEKRETFDEDLSRRNLHLFRCA